MLKPNMFVSRNDHLDLVEIDQFPILKGVLGSWTRTRVDGIPAEVDQLDFPPQALPYLMLVDLVGDNDAVIRLAGTAACDLYGRELKGTSVYNFFGTSDAHQVLSDLQSVVEHETPTLTLRSYVSINGKPWSYARLLLPLRPTAGPVTRILKAIEPTTFRAIPRRELQSDR